MEMVNYFVCPCIFDVVLISTHKEIDDLIKSNFLNVGYLIFDEESNIYICCKKNIEFYYTCYSRSVIFESCGDISDPINCFDLLCYGFENICLEGKKLILKYFLDILIKVQK